MTSPRRAKARVGGNSCKAFKACSEQHALLQGCSKASLAYLCSSCAHQGKPKHAKTCHIMPKHAKTCHNMPMLQNMQKNLTSVQNLHSGFTVALVGETLAPKHSDTTKGVLKDLILTHPRMDEKVLVLTQAAEISSRPFVLQTTAPDPSQRDKTRSLSPRLSAFLILCISCTNKGWFDTKYQVFKTPSKQQRSTRHLLLVSFSCRAARR